MSVNVGEAVGYLDLDISGFISNLKTAQSEANMMSKNIATSVGDNLQSAGKKMTSAGTSLTKSVTLPVVGLGTAIVKTSANFESSMSKVQAISGATGSDFDKLKAKAQEMGAKTKFSASESAQAFQYMAMAGWDVNSMLGGISGVMNLAAASGEDLGTVSDIVTDAMTAFGLSAKETSVVLKDGLKVEVDNTTRFVDALAAASNSSNTNVAMLGESFKYVAPVAGALGYSIEDVAVALGLMANQGIKSSQSGTSLRTILTNMANPTDKMKAAMDALGVSLENGDGSMKSLMEVMQDLRKGFGGGTMDATEFTNKMSELDAALQQGTISEEDYEQAVNELCVAMYGAEGAQKAQIAAMLAGKTGMAGLLAIVNSTDEDFQKLTKSIYNASGTSQEMADIMLNNLSGQLTILKSQLEGVALQLGEILMPHMKKFVENLQQLVQKFSELSPAQQEMIVKFTLLAASIGPVLIVFGKLIASIGSIFSMLGGIPNAIASAKGAFTAMGTSIVNVKEAFVLAKAGMTGFASQTSVLGTALAGITGPMVAIVAVIASLVAAFVTLWKNNEYFRQRITSIWGEITDKFKESFQKITDAVNSLGFDFQNIKEVISAAWNGLCSMLAPVFIAVFNYISSIVQGFVGVFTGVFEIITGIIKGFKDGDWSLFIQGLKDTFFGWIDIIKAPFQGIFTFFVEVLHSFGTTWENVWSGVVSFFQSIWGGIKGFFSSIWSGIVNVTSGAWNSIKQIATVGIMLLKSVLEFALDVLLIPWNFIWQNFGEYLTKAWETIKGLLSGILTGIGNVIVGAWQYIYGAIQPVITSISSFISSIWNTISGVISSIMGVIGGIISSTWSTIKNVITSTMSTISSIISSTWNTAKAIVTSVMNAIGSVISSVWNKVKSITSSTFNNVKNLISQGLNAAKQTVTSLLGDISNAFTTKFNGIKSFMSGVVSWLKGIFKFEWKLPHIKLPHFKVSGKFSLDPPSAPSFGIEWYKKAMNGGMILNGATIFGMKGNKFLGGGEAGSEVVAGTNSLMSMIRCAVSEQIQMLIAAIRDAMPSSNDGGDIVIPVYIGGDAIDTIVVSAQDRNNYRSGGR